MTTGNQKIDISVDAGEYVLGTLDEAARARLEHEMVFDPALREQVRYWESRLQPMLDDVEPITPPAKVWETIKERTHGSIEKTPWWRSLGLWRGLATVSLAASLFLSVTLMNFMQSPSPSETGQSPIHPVSMAVVNDKKNDPMWLVECYKEPWRMSVSVVPGEIPAHGKSLQLWAVPKQGEPMSLGLVPTHGKMDMPLSDKAGKMMGEVKAFAVSVEPPGGSTTGKPTGPINYTGGVVAL